MIRLTKNKNKKFTRKHNPEHEQVLIEGKYVDKGIANLLKLIWSKGIKTVNSCEENKPGIIWIQFQSINDLNKFLNRIARYPKGHGENFWDTMYGRMMNLSNEKENWNYDMVIPVNYGVEEKLIKNSKSSSGYEAIETFTGKHDIDFNPSLRFPKKDLTEIMRNL